MVTSPWGLRVGGRPAAACFFAAFFLDNDSYIAAIPGCVATAHRPIRGAARETTFSFGPGRAHRVRRLAPCLAHAPAAQVMRSVNFKLPCGRPSVCGFLWLVVLDKLPVAKQV